MFQLLDQCGKYEHVQLINYFLFRIPPNSAKLQSYFSSLQYLEEQNAYFNQMLEDGNIAHAVNEKDDKFFDVKLLIFYFLKYSLNLNAEKQMC